MFDVENKQHMQTKEEKKYYCEEKFFFADFCFLMSSME